jgi:anaerobic selenocysteine-containing dehydrogenase
MTPGPGDGQIRDACPPDCPDTCSRIATVKNGEPAALRGDPAHPYSRGSLCNNSGAVYHDNRVRVDRVRQEAI